MGATTFYSCKVAGDETGAYFIDDLNRVGVGSNPHAAVARGKSGRCLVLITPDAERSMNTAQDQMTWGVNATNALADASHHAQKAAQAYTAAMDAYTVADRILKASMA